MRVGGQVINVGGLLMRTVEEMDGMHSRRKANKTY